MKREKLEIALHPSRQGTPPVWCEKNPEIYQLMLKTGLRQYEVAYICGKHPDSLSKKLRFPLPEKEKEMIINTVEKYLQEHPDFLTEVK